MEIVTARLRLDALRAEDAAALLAYRGDPAVSRFQGWAPTSLADAARFIDAQQHVDLDTAGTWWQRAIRLRDPQELIGDLGLHFVADATVEVGISVAPAHQRNGYAREALEVALDLVFGGLHKHRVLATVDRRNTACIELMEAIGMRREADVNQSGRDGGARTDDVVFAMLARDWLAPPSESD